MGTMQGAMRLLRLDDERMTDARNQRIPALKRKTDEAPVDPAR